MSQDMKEFYLMLGLFILLFVFVAFFISIVNRRFSRWNELAAHFPMPPQQPDTAFFKYCAGRVGRIGFNGRRNGFTVGFVPAGILIKSIVRKQPDILVPWSKIQSASRLMFGSKTRAKIEIDSPVMLYFILSGDALAAFETWHFLEFKTIDQYKDDIRRKMDKHD